MSATYLDASAVAKLFLDEPGLAELVTVIAAAPDRVTSIVSLVEVPGAVARCRSPIGLEEVEAAVGSMHVIGLDRTIAARTASLGPIGLRTLDAIHLATALELVPDLQAFVTDDPRLADAALAAGLRVAEPGSGCL